MKASLIDWNGSVGSISPESLLEVLGGHAYDNIEVVSDRTGERIIFEKDSKIPGYRSECGKFQIVLVQSFPFKTEEDLKGVKFAVTGQLPVLRTDVVKRLTELGASISPGITKDVKYLIDGGNTKAGLKYQFAMSHSIPTIDGQKFVDWLESVSGSF